MRSWQFSCEAAHNKFINYYYYYYYYHPAFNIVTWTPFCLNVLGCLDCLYYNDHQMRKRFLLQMVCGWISKHKHSISNVSFLCYIIEWILAIFMARKFGMGYFSRGRHSLIWPIRVCAAEQGTVFKVLSLKQGIQFHYWASWTGCLFGLEAFQRVWRLAMSGVHLQYQ